MNEERSEQSLGKKLVALMAAVGIAFGVTLSGCGPEEFEAPDQPDEEMPLPGEPTPEPDEEAPVMPPEDDDADNDDGY